MLDDFLIRAGLAGLALALAAGPLGCFVVWRRMAYFGDATAHAAILGVAIALAFDFSLMAGTLVVALAMASSVSALSGRGHSMDATLGVLSHSALAIGLIAISLVPGQRVDLTAYLFGDILAVNVGEIAVMWLGALSVLVLLGLRWSALLTSTLNEDLAAASGLRPHRERMVLTLSLAVVVALAIKVVGALLIAAMLIIPAAAARSFARTPEVMAVISAVIGALAVIAGLFGSLSFDTPAGPSIVASASIAFAGSVVWRGLVRARWRSQNRRRPPK